MENEEILTGVIEENVDNAGEETDGSAGRVLAILGIGALVVGAGVATFIYTQKDKIEAKRIEKLRAKGYVIYKGSDRLDKIEEDDADDFEDFEGEVEED